MVPGEPPDEPLQAELVVGWVDALLGCRIWIYLEHAMIDCGIVPAAKAINDSRSR